MLGAGIDLLIGGEEPVKWYRAGAVVCSESRRSSWWRPVRGGAAVGGGRAGIPLLTWQRIGSCEVYS